MRVDPLVVICKDLVSCYFCTCEIILDWTNIFYDAVSYKVLSNFNITSKTLKQ